MSELPPQAMHLRHQDHHPFGLIYKGVRYVEGHAKILANEHHSKNKLIWFKGLVDHVRVKSMQNAHYNIHEGQPILKVTVDGLKEKLDGMVAAAPPEARAKLHEEGWKMIHDLVNDLRTEAGKHREVYLKSELEELTKLSGLIRDAKASDPKLTEHLQTKACELHGQGVSLVDIHQAAPNAFKGEMDEAALGQLMKDNPDAALQAIKDGKHRTTKHASEVEAICKKLAPKNAVIAASAKVVQ